jgi:carboxyl-terminal processing protease
MTILALVSGLSILIALTSDDVGQADYSQTAVSINSLLRKHHYDPEELNTPEYLLIEEKVLSLGADVSSDADFLSGFRAIWKDGPFSHVNLSKAQSSASEMAAYLDTMKVGDGGAVLSWVDDTAILTVNTMMGTDTIEAIEAAYDDISSHGADKLIIDLRQNQGGAFAVRPLIEHLIDDPYAAGAFVARRWNADHEAPPTLEEAKDTPAWDGWSIISFWDDAQTKPFIWLELQPSAPHYDGPVYVLTSQTTASAAELAADALKGSGRATLIGEVTAGQMLSQKPFDVPGGFHLFLPIADYFSFANGRIEGHGVEPDIAVDPAQAMETALGK